LWGCEPADYHLALFPFWGILTLWAHLDVAASIDLHGYHNNKLVHLTVVHHLHWLYCYESQLPGHVLSSEPPECKAVMLSTNAMMFIPTVVVAEVKE
jgi:hypothetical protein